MTEILFLQTNELYQLASVAFCLLVAWVRLLSKFLPMLGLALLKYLSGMHERPQIDVVEILLCIIYWRLLSAVAHFFWRKHFSSWIYISLYDICSAVTLQCSDKLGLSLELGSFAAGVMISTTDLAQHTLEQVWFAFFILFLLFPSDFRISPFTLVNTLCNCGRFIL